MALIVQKFGGSSVADVDKIRHVARVVANTHDDGNQVVVVVSAMGKTTDGLVKLAHEITPNPTGEVTGREYDALLSTGEQVTTALLAMTLNTMGYQAIGLNGGQAGIVTEALHNRARILEIDSQAITQHTSAGKIVIITGFQGIDRDGNITTLGRGGSDTSAVALAGALNAECCDIYTDVNGVYSTDPRIVPHAVRLDRVAYIEMLELARVGAKVLHPRSVETARQAGVKLRVRSTFTPEDDGTMVTGVDALELDRRITGIACDNHQARLAIEAVPDTPGMAARVFGAMAKGNISVDMIIQSLNRDTDGKATNDIAFTVNGTDCQDAEKVLTKVCEELGAKAIHADSDVAKVSIVGAGMIDRPGIAADMFAALAEADVNIKMIATSEIKISCLVPKAQAEQAIQTLHKAFFPEAEPGSKMATDNVLVNEKLGY